MVAREKSDLCLMRYAYDCKNLRAACTISCLTEVSGDGSLVVR